MFVVRTLFRFVIIIMQKVQCHVKPGHMYRPQVHRTECEICTR